MSSIITSLTGGMSGNSGGAGLNFQGQSANILNPVTTDQATTAYNNAQTGLNNQASFLAATQAQNGLANQSQVYNQLQGVVNGTGPNPAQAQLAQATGANVANQAALMAGQRGSNANAGLIARQAAMQGANTQQQSAGQAATLQAQQSLNALNSAGSMANTQAGQQQSATNSYTNAAQSEQQNLLNGIAQQNNANVGMTSNINSAGASVSGEAAKGQQQTFGSLASAAGQVMMLADGGAIAPITIASPNGAATDGPTQSGGPQSTFGKAMSGLGADSQGKTPVTDGLNSLTQGIGHTLKGIFGSSPGPGAGEMTGADSMGGSMTGAGDMGAMMMAAQGGKVPAMVSPGEQYLKPDQAQKVAEGKANPMKTGEKIPGKAKVSGAKNSYANDTVPKELEVGGIVIPRDVTQAKDAEKKAVDFVRAHFARQNIKKGK